MRGEGNPMEGDPMFWTTMLSGSDAGKPKAYIGLLEIQKSGKNGLEIIRGRSNEGRR